MQLGMALSGINSGYFGYVYSGSSGSTSSYLTMGLFGVDRIVNITGNRYVGINTTSPAYTCDINGTFRASGSSILSGIANTGTLSSTGTISGPIAASTLNS